MEEIRGGFFDAADNPLLRREEAAQFMDLHQRQVFHGIEDSLDVAQRVNRQCISLNYSPIENLSSLWHA